MSRYFRSLYWSFYFLSHYHKVIFMSYSADQLAKLSTLANAVAAAATLEAQDDAAVAAAQTAATTRDTQFASDGAALKAQQDAQTAALQAAYDGDKKALAATLATAQAAATADDGATTTAVATLLAFAQNPN